LFFENPLFRSPLFDEANADGVAAGGDGTNAEAGEQQQQPPQPPPISLKDIQDLLKAERAATLSEVTKQINGLDAKYSKAQKKQDQSAATSGATAEQLRSQQMEQERQEWQERIATIEREREEEKKNSQRLQLESTVNTGLTGLPWRADNKGNPEGYDVAYTYYSTKAERAEDGSLHIGGMPLAQFIKEDAQRRFKGFFPAREVGGSGAAPGSRTGAGVLSSATLIEKAQSGARLSDDERKAVRDELLSNPTILRYLGR
jgi:DNA-binding transcriptional MerR regulator